MLNATLVKKIEITEHLLIYRVKPDEEIPDFTAGQYVALGLMPENLRPSHFPVELHPQKPEKLIKRTYSIASSPVEKNYFEFYLAIVPDGTLSSRLCYLQEGERLYCAPKVTGKFTLDVVPPEANVVMVATGTGLAPFLSMLRTPSTWEQPGKITLVYGVRYQTDVAYLQELQDLTKEHENFTFAVTVSRPSEDWPGHKGYVQTLFESNQVMLDSLTDHLMLCGNPAMIDDMQKYLESKGFIENTRKLPGNIHLEKYW